MTPAYKTHGGGGGVGGGYYFCGKGCARADSHHLPSANCALLFPAPLSAVSHSRSIYTTEISKCNKPGLFSDCGLLNIYQHIIAAATDTTPLSGSHARPQGHPCMAFCLLNSWDSATEVRWLRRIVLSSVCPTPVQLSSLLPFLGLLSICFPWNLSFSFQFNEPGSHLGLVQVHSLYLFFGLNSQQATWQEPHQYDRVYKV